MPLVCQLLLSCTTAAQKCDEPAGCLDQELTDVFDHILRLVGRAVPDDVCQPAEVVPQKSWNDALLCQACQCCSGGMLSDIVQG